MIVEDDEKTHFGFQEVPRFKKTKMVEDVFQSVAPQYDVMNDLMSFGLHRLWKGYAVQKAQLKPGHYVLDNASGTGDLAIRIAKKIGQKGLVVLSDINPAMLKIGRARLVDAGCVGNMTCIQADAECLPFQTNLFDRVMIAFGLRNVTNKDNAIASMYQVLKPGGKICILEFSHPYSSMLNKLYNLYSFQVIPKVGEWVTHDRRSYQYLVESIRMHPNQEKLKNMLETAGFETVQYENLNGGIVALHTGYKY